MGSEFQFVLSESPDAERLLKLGLWMQKAVNVGLQLHGALIVVGCVYLAVKIGALEYGAVIYKLSFTGRKLQADHSGTHWLQDVKPSELTDDTAKLC